MATRFEAVPSPTSEKLAALGHLGLQSPFNTSEYVNARTVLGAKPWLLGVYHGTEIIGGCIAFLSGRVLSRRVEIMTVPHFTEPKVFWDGLSQFCREQRVWDLIVHSFGSTAAEIPSLPGELSRRQRYEFVLDLTSPDLLVHISQNHRRNIKRAQKAGLVIQQTRDKKANQHHLQLMRASMERRKERGETVSILDNTCFFEALLQSKAGELFQVIDEGKVCSSIMVIRSHDVAYYQSAGTSPEGMNKGASPLLISEIARILKDEGVRQFNLGGAEPENPGLHRFKSGFGAHMVELEAASFSMVSPIKRKLRSTAKRILHRSE